MKVRLVSLWRESVCVCVSERERETSECHCVTE